MPFVCIRARGNDLTGAASVKEIANGLEEPSIESGLVFRICLCLFCAALGFIGVKFRRFGGEGAQCCHDFGQFY